MDWTPGEACRQGAKECDEHDVDGVLILQLKRGRTATSCDTRILNSGVSVSEAVALLEVIKFGYLRELNGE